MALIVVAGAVVYLLEWLKAARWMRWLTRRTVARLRLVATVLAVLAGLVLHAVGLYRFVASDLGNVALLILSQFVLQRLLYDGCVHQQTGPVR